MAGEKYTFRGAVYLVLVKDENILLSRRHNTGWQDGMYSLPAGHIEKNETVAGAIIRESKEEIGITLKESDIEVVHVMHRRSPDQEYFDFFFTAKTWSGEIKNCEPEKCDELGWFPLKNLPKNLLPYITEMLQHIEKKNFFSESVV